MSLKTIIAVQCILALTVLAVSPAAGAPLPLWNKAKVPWIDSAKEFFVAPEGAANNPGSKAAPWDLATGFKANVPAGSVIWLRGGTYGQGGGTLFTCSVKGGTQQQPVILRGYPGERVTIDGGIDTNVPWVWFWGFEVTNSYATRKAPPNERNKGLDMRGRGQRAINMLIHDTGHPSLGFWTPLGDGAEAYGCLLWHCGRYTMGRQANDYTGGPVGSFYGHNTDGTRYITDNIAFRNFTMGLYMGSSGNAHVDGVVLEGNVCFQNYGNILLQADKQPMTRNRIVGNFLYQKRTTQTKGGLQLGYSKQENLDVVVQNNYLVADIGDERQVHMKRWKDVVFTGNTVISPTCLIALERPPSGAGKYQWDNNQYFGGEAAPFKHDGAKQNFEQWQQAAGLDRNSTYSTKYPTETKVFVRSNQYEPGRGHVVIYNWSKEPKVQVDLSSVLPKGTAYEVRDAQNYFAPALLSGIYDGKAVAFPMTMTQIMMPVGECPHLQPYLSHTAPEFGVFVVLPKGPSQP